MRRPTLVTIKHFNARDMRFTHGMEIAPGLLSDDEVNQLIDGGYVKESKERRSLYRLFHRFSGCAESENLDADEIESYTLQA
jgi:hypothetical protein